MKITLKILLLVFLIWLANAQQTQVAFFTTKPTGQGTSLGLSYDIVKAYGGSR